MMTFSDIQTGERFTFDYGDLWWAWHLAQGPWIKTGRATYVHEDARDSLMLDRRNHIRVGSLAVSVVAMDRPE